MNRYIVILTIFLTLFILVMFVNIKVDQINVGYAISKNTKREKTLLEERRKLSVELSNLQSPHRLQIMANKLGFRFPVQNDIFYIEKSTIVSNKE